MGLDFDAYVAKGGTYPEVMLVRKSFEERRRKRKAKGLGARTWKLKHLDMEVRCFVWRCGVMNAPAQMIP